MSRKWMPNGVMPSVPHKQLAEDTKKQIIEKLNKRNIHPKDMDGFWEDVDCAVGTYYTMKEIGEQSSPSSVRSNLEAVMFQVLSLNDAVNALDHNSKNLVNEAEDITGSNLRSHISELVKIVSKANKYAKEYPARGRLTEYYKINLAEGLGEALQKHTGVKLSATPHAIFDEIVSLVMCDIQDKDQVNAKAIIEKALARVPNN